MRLCSILVALLFVTIGTDTGFAQTSFPMITHTTPVAVQRGVTSDVTVSGRMNFYGAYKVLVEGTGVEAEIVPDKKKAKPGKGRPTITSVKLKVTVSPDAPLGVREFRIASVLGISSIGQLLVVDDPVVLETKANNTREQAQDVKLPQVITGRLEVKEDVDYYKFTAKAGEHLTFEMQCARLQDKIHDLQKHAKPILVLYDAEGRELASNDHFYFADPLLAYQTKKDGVFYLQVRESTYDGDARWVYAVIATNKAYASHVYPMAGNPGKVVQVEPVGSAKEQQTKIAVRMPDSPGVHSLELNVNGQKTYPVTVVASKLPQTLETEDNDTPQKATRINLPCGINGRIGELRDLDHFVFKGIKGKTIYFEAKARRFGTLLNSTVHAVLDVMTPDGKIMASNIDSHGDEASLSFTAKADADYVLRVRDLNSKGGPSSVYFISADWAQPDFELKCDPDKAMIGPGSSTAWFVQVTRQHGFKGDVKVKVKGLPKGMACNELTIPSPMTEGMLILTADEDANQEVSNIDVIGTATVTDESGKESTITHRATPMQEIYSPGGGRALFPVSMQTVAITEPSDILKVKVDKQNIVLKPGQEVKLEVTVERNKDYTKNVTIDVLLRHLNRVYGNALPPGVTIVAGKSKTLLGKGSKGHIVLKAAANAAPIENVPLAVLAHVSINFVVKVSYSSEPLFLTIRK